MKSPFWIAREQQLTHTGKNLHANDFLKFHYVQGGGICILYFFPGRLEQLKIIKRKKD